jgi:hypothetical protein
LRVRHIGGGLVSEAGPLTLAEGRALARILRGRLHELEAALAAASQWRSAAGWGVPDAADQWPASGPIEG